MLKLEDIRRARLRKEGERLRGSFRDFIPEAWKIVEPGKKFKSNWHIDAIADHLQAVSDGEITRLIINIPPRHMKSLAVSVFWPVWDWTNNPYRQWLFASYAQVLSTRDSLKCRRLMQSKWYQDRFGHIFSLTSDQNLKQRYENDKMGYRISTSVGGALTGDGGDIICIDDAHNAVDGESEVKRASTIEWWTNSMSSRLNDPVEGAYVIIMQRLHEDDLVGHILAEEHGWDHLMIPAEYEKDHPHPMTSSLGWKDPRTVEGEILWPNRFPEPKLREMATRMGPYAAAGQLQQRPAPAEGGLFKREYIRYYKPKEDYYELLHPDGEKEKVLRSDCWRFITADTAMTEQTWSDWTVRMVWDVEKQRNTKGELVAGRMFLVDVWRAQCETPKVEKQFRNDMVRWNPIFIGIEDKNDGKVINQRFRLDNIPVRPIPADNDKITRATIAEIWMAAHKVWFPHNSHFLDILESELLTFPNAKHDDQVDTLSHAVTFAHNNSLWRPLEIKGYNQGSFGAIDGHNDLFTKRKKMAGRKDPFAKR